MNPTRTKSCETRPHSPSSLQSDAISTPSSSFREAIIAAAEKLEHPVAKKRRSITTKPHNGLRKFKAQKAYDALSAEAIHASNTVTVQSGLKSYSQRSRDHGYRKSPSQAPLTDAPIEAISKLGAFKFQPPRVSTIEDYCTERTSIYKANSLGENISAETLVLAQTMNCKLDPQKRAQSVESQETMEATLPLDLDHFGLPGLSDARRLLYDTCKTLSPSPLVINDYDQDSLDDAFQAAEDSLSLPLPGAADHEESNLLHDAKSKPDAVDSEFGSDPFEPDNAEHQDHSHINSPGSISSQSAQIDFHSPQADFGSMLPPSYQTPRKSSPTEMKPKSSPDRLPITPDSWPVHKQASSQERSPTPFLRPSFPKPAPARSAISDLTPETRIITCFRTAEYLRAISSSNSAPGLLIELYAHVISSTRVGRAQHFTFADLFFPQRPPHLHGTCTTWQGSELYEDDTRPFLGTSKEQARLCRAIVRPKKFAAEGGSTGGERGNGEASRLSALGGEMEVLNIWQATWDDVEYVRGIVCA